MLLYTILRSLLISILILLPYSTSKAQNNYLINKEQKTAMLRMLSDSTTNSYVSYKRTLISIGYKKANDEKELLIKTEALFNISYRISSFFNNIEEQKTQVGLFNEIGINNFSFYVDFGPEARLRQNLYIIPFVEISLPVTLYGIGFLPYLGTKIGLFKRISTELTIYFEGNLQFRIPETKFKKNYVKIGIGFDLFN